MRYLLYFRDGPGGERPFDWTWIDKWCGLYGLHPVSVSGCHPEKKQRDRPPYHFRRLEDAVQHPDFRGHSWVWLDPEAENYWDEVELPADDVIFCVGDDLSGFNGFEWEGQRVRLRAPAAKHDGVWYAAMVVPLLLFRVYGP